MLIALRIIFGVALACAFVDARNYSASHANAVDVFNAMHVAICAIFGIANAIVWAPYVGAKLSDPLTGAMVDSTYVDQKNQLLRLTRWLNYRGHRKFTVLFSFLEGIHKPDNPTAFIIGLKNARPGSWFEKVFAREVYRFENIQNCVQAYSALQQRGIDPGFHAKQEVNLALRSLSRTARPDPEKLEIPTAEPARQLRRNPRVRLFDKADGKST